MTTTVAKPKAARSIVTTKVTTSGVKTALAKSFQEQLEKMAALCNQLSTLPEHGERFKAAGNALDGVLDAFQESLT
jgi:hypothetical protein